MVMLDRLTHKAHIVTCDWESYRLKESLQIKGLSSGKVAKTPSTGPVFYDHTHRF